MAIINRYCATEGILPSACKVGKMTWEGVHVILDAEKYDSDPGIGPSKCLFVPETVKKQLLSWDRNLKFTCHPCSLLPRNTLCSPICLAIFGNSLQKSHIMCYK